MELPSTLRRGTYNLSQQQRIGPEHHRAVGGFVRKVRRHIVDEVLGTQHAPGPKACMKQLAAQKCLYKLLAKHNDPRTKQDVKYDDVICLGSQFNNGVLYLCLSTVSMLMNVFRSINSGWPVTWMGDGTFNLCDHKLCVLTGTVNELRNKNYWVSIAIVLEEESPGYTALCKDTIRGAHALKDNRQCRRDGCELCYGMRDILAGRHMKKWMDSLLPGQSLSLPFKYTMSDNTGKFAKFVKYNLPDVGRNICRAHLTGIARQKQSHVKHFRAHADLPPHDWYDAWYDIILQAMNCPYLHIAEDVQHMIFDWLNEHGQVIAVAWFAQNWMLPDHGRWMICFFEHGGPLNNNGTEGNNGGYKTSTLGASGAKTALKPRELVANTCTFLARKSEEQRVQLQKSLGATASFRSLPSPLRMDVLKLKKMHPRVAQLIVPMKHQEQWQAQMAKFMGYGSSDLSLFERLNAYQKQRETYEELDVAAFLNPDDPIDFYIPSDGFMLRIDPHRARLLEPMMTQITEELKHHLLMADEKQWGDYIDARLEGSSSEIVYKDGVVKALERLYNFHRMRIWKIWCEESNDDLLIIQCFCPNCFKNGFCRHAWVLQILLNRKKSYIIHFEKKGEIDKEDIPRRPSKRDKHAKVQKPKEQHDKVRREWNKISLDPKSLPRTSEAEEEFSDAFKEAEDDWYRSQGALQWPEYQLHEDEYKGYQEYLAVLKQERVCSPHIQCKQCTDSFAAGRISCRRWSAYVRNGMPVHESTKELPGLRRGGEKEEIGRRRTGIQTALLTSHTHLPPSLDTRAGDRIHRVSGRCYAGQ